MGDVHGFKKFGRVNPKKETVENRLKHFNEFYIADAENLVDTQSARCMDCGVPFCHSGCPLGNKIPDFNHAVYEGNWKLAYETLMSTNNFPEFTGRICPAPCEASCVLGINSDPVSIEFIEKSIIEKAFEEGWVKPKRDIVRTGKSVAVIGSGPAGLAAADQLNKAGHKVVVFEKNTRAGGLLRYGIPDFKLDKKVIDRRIKLMEEEGIEFMCNIEVGKDISAIELKNQYDALILCGGSSVPRDLQVEGRKLKGIHFAMDYLERNNKRVAGDDIDFSSFDIQGKDVLVIGGGDTGADCIGTSNRLGANSIIQIELLSKPGNVRTDKDPWPNWPMILKTSSSHEEGCDREWSILTKRFISEDGIHVSGVEVVNITWELDGNKKPYIKEDTTSSRIIPCEYVFLAIGFLHPQFEGLLEELNVELDARRNVACNKFHSSVEGVFSAGDMRRGQSLVVWAIAEGREAALEIDKYLMSNQYTLTSNSKSLLAI